MASHPDEDGQDSESGAYESYLFEQSDICLEDFPYTGPQRHLPQQQHEYQQQVEEGRKAMKKAEEYLASGLNELSVEERAKAMDDVHCVGEGLQETSEMIQLALENFHEVIQRTAPLNPIYEAARKQNQLYVEDPEFRLAFLRANKFDPEKSVHQMMELLKHKATYFGPDKVASDISLSDLTDEDRSHLTSGLYHIQEERDRMGRLIVYSFNDLIGTSRAETLIRSMYHLSFNILIPMLEAQKKGIVYISYDTKKPGKRSHIPDLLKMMIVNTFSTSVPLRCTAIHCCITAPGESFALNSTTLGLWFRFLPASTRARTRIHHGTHKEVQDALRSHGIPMNKFPVDTDGNIRRELQNVWFHKHVPRSEAPKQHSSTTEEQVDREKKGSGFFERDVLLGRGRLVQYHPGNVYFRQFLEAHAEAHNSTARNKKHQFSIDLTRKLIEGGVRFMKPGKNNGWIECDFKESVDKVAQFFRTLLKK